MRDTTDPSLPNPLAREDVVFRRVGEDWLLFDPVTREIHVLNLSAALAWSFCDGTRSRDEVAAAVGEAFRATQDRDSKPPESGGPEDEVAAVLEDFQAKGLLEEAE